MSRIQSIISVGSGFWKDKQVLVTGHTGFKGGWLCTWLLEKGAKVAGYALDPVTNPSFFELCGLSRIMHSVIGDIGDRDSLENMLQKENPEIIFHLAAQPIVRQAYQDPVRTLFTNVMGTAYLLEAVRHVSSVRVVVVVTSDKCYQNKEWIWGYREEDALGGDDPYSASKGCAELVTHAYRRSFFEGNNQAAALATVRAGNVMGGGDWGEDRIIPDAVRAFSKGQPLVVRNPASVRPWQHVLDPLSGYLMLAEKLYAEKKGWEGAWNFGPSTEEAVTVVSLVEKIVRAWGNASWKAVSNGKAPHETRYLKLDSSKAWQILGWRSLLGLDEAVEMTVEWYRKALFESSHKNLHALTCAQIQEYETRKLEQQNLETTLI